MKSVSFEEFVKIVQAINVYGISDSNGDGKISISNDSIQIITSNDEGEIWEYDLTTENNPTILLFENSFRAVVICSIFGNTWEDFTLLVPHKF